MAAETMTRQIDVLMDMELYQALETVAAQERQSLPQAARTLIAEGLHRRLRLRHGAEVEDVTGSHLAILASSGGAFDWLAEEPDFYDDQWGEPV